MSVDRDTPKPRGEIRRGWYRYRCVIEHNPYARRPWRAVVERHFVGWEAIHTRRFRTNEKADAYVEKWYRHNAWKEPDRG